MNSNLTEEPYLSQEDEEEAKRLLAMTNVHGIGEVMYLDDTQVKQYHLNDFGIMDNE